MTGFLLDIGVAGTLVGTLGLACGLVYGVLGVMDLTLGLRVAIGAYAGWWVANVLAPEAYPLYLPAAWLAAGVAGALSGIFAWWMLRPLAAASPLVALVGSLGLQAAGQAALLFSFGSASQVFSGYPAEEGIEIAGTTATPLDLVFLVFATSVVVSAAVGLRSTRIGSMLVATGVDPAYARAGLGIPVRRLEWGVMAGTGFVLGVAGFLYGVSRGVSPETGSSEALLAFVATVVAGRRHPILSSLAAVALTAAGMAAVRAALPTSTEPIVPLMLVIVTLLLRPHGIFATPARSV